MAADRTALQPTRPAPTPEEAADLARRNEEWIQLNLQWQREAELKRLAQLKEDNPRRYYLETLPEPVDYVRAYPALLAGAMRAGRVPEARVYLLLRALDPSGRGVVDVDRARLYYSHKHSPYRVMGWRRLRQVLAAGDGLFWQRDDRDRLWVKSPAHIAAGLGVDRLRGLPVGLPVVSLLESLSETRAAIYAAWHAGRGEAAGPVSRAAIRSQIGAAESTQRTYDHIVDVKRRRNVVILGDATRENIERHAWVRGAAIFRLRDYLGRHGRPGWVYLAANMPASYTSKYDVLPKGRTRKVNRRLDNLVIKGETRGKGSQVVDRTKVYHEDGAAAGDAYNRDQGDNNHYWRMGPVLKEAADRPAKLDGVAVWGVIYKK